MEPGQLTAPQNETPNEQEPSIEEPSQPHPEMEPRQLTVPQKETPNDQEPSIKEPSQPHPEENNNNDRVKLPMTFRAINETTQSDQGHRQLIIKGIKTEFPLLTDTLESKETREAVVDLHMRLKVMEVLDGDIITAAPTILHARNNSHVPIKKTYRDEKTKNKILRAARASGLLDPPSTLGGLAPFFMEVTVHPPNNNNKTQQTKKKKAKESNSKKGSAIKDSLATAEQRRG